jgi:lysophospholipase L1-like esterase
LPFAPTEPVHADDDRPFELLDGDRVVFIGNTFIERDQVYGYLETMLTARWPDRNITFRNLGWSGDTVWGEARARFGTAADGFQHLKDHVEAIKPTVLFIGYGANEAFDGEPGLPRFERGLNSLIEMLAAATAPNARMIVLSPLQQENHGPPLANPMLHNEELMRYSDLIQSVARARGLRFVDLLPEISDPPRGRAGTFLTDNGVHLSDYGYWRVAHAILRDLRLEPRSWSVELGKDGTPAKVTGVRIDKFEKLAHGMRFEATAERLPSPRRPSRHKERYARITEFGEAVGTEGVFGDLAPGQYSLRIDNESGTIKTTGPAMIPYESDRIEQLRRTIIEKNRLYFHRWRPQNETYLFGFRKHEQGQNAAEVPKFDPLVEELEAKIAKLRVPVKHTYELIRQD